MNLERFVAEFFREYRALSGEPNAAYSRSRPSIEGSPSEELRGRIEDDPEQAWTLILALLKRAPDEDALGFVAAGPLEDFIMAHGETQGARIAAEAGTNGRLRKALDQTWVWASVPDPVWQTLMPLLSPAMQAHWVAVLADPEKMRRRPRSG